MTEMEELWVKIIMADLKHKAECGWSYFDPPQETEIIESEGVD